MGVGPAPSKMTILGLQTQSAEGTEADDSSIVWCPYAENSDLGEKGALVPLDQADLVHEPNIALLEGKWWEGSMPVRFRPVSGFLSVLFNSTNGLINKTARNNYNLAPTFSVYKVDTVAGSQRVRKGYDCRVDNWTLRARAGRAQPVEFTMAVRGKYTGTYSGGAVVAESWARPYYFRECRVRFNIAGGGYAYDVNLKEIEIAGNEHLQDMDAGQRLGSGPEPARMYNEGEQTVRLTCVRDQVDTIIYQAYLNQRDNISLDSGNAFAMDIEFSSGGQTVTLTCPRLGFNEYSDDFPGSKVGLKEERFVLDAYASADGSTGACQIT